jgi:hypothetical protein
MKNIMKGKWRNAPAYDTADGDIVGEEETVKTSRTEDGGPAMEYTETHPSFGVVQISRGHGGDITLFDSSITHNDTISLTICHAERNRGLHRDWIHSKEHIVEVEMSNEQFAAMITHLNSGDGTPCTLRSIGGKRIPRASYVNPNTEFREEFNREARGVGHSLDAVVSNLEAQLAGGRLSVKDIRLVLQQLKMVRQEIVANMPFVAKQFAEHMEHVVTEAKTEVEAFVTNTIHRTGLEAMREKSGLSGGLLSLNLPPELEEEGKKT